MARPKVYVTRKILSPGLEIISEYCDYEIWPDVDYPPPRNVLIEKIRDKDGLLCLLTDKIDAEVMDAAPNLKVISTYSVGYDHIDVDAATKRGIYVCYTPGVLTNATADFAWALMLAAARRVCEADRYVKEGKWDKPWNPFMLLGVDVYGKTLGIIGLGRIGRAVAERAKGFNMKIIYYDVYRLPPDEESKLGVEYRSLEDVLRNADFISIHVPLTKDTYHLIGEKELRMMKPTAILVNTSRGPVVDEKALYRALKERWIRAAGIDVWEQEPTPKDNPLLALDNLVAAPHIASASEEARSAMAEMAAKNLVAVLKGEMPPALANPNVLKIRPLDKVKVI
jgi:glyoxylate reductase